MNDLFQAADGAQLLRAFERIAADATAAHAPVPVVLEAAAMGVALGALGLVDRAPLADRVVSRTRRALLSVAVLRRDAEDDALDALDLAITRARLGMGQLSGGPITSLDGPPCDEPTPEDVARLMRGELDGLAAADVALRLHRSGARGLYAAFLPQGEASSKRIRLAADSAPVIRDPAHGRRVGMSRLGSVALEAFAFDDGAIAIYAEPAVPISAAIDAPLAERPIETAGYVELRLADARSSVTVTLTHEERSVTWTIALA